ncbi:MAG: hypothetical protein PHQ98_03085 [Candidatus ainarchaeum sp.]|nr:hypothetical protein [Candidatus ainarchaeum sp.]
MYPNNKDYFKKLIPFAREIIKLCNQNKIHVILYGSFAHFYYTKQRMAVNDIDLMILKKDYNKFLKLLKTNQIDFEYNLEKKEIFIKKNNLLIEVDVIGSNYSELLPSSKIKGYIQIDFYGELVNVVNLKTIEKIYIIANNCKNKDWKKILMRTKDFEKFLGRKIL